MTWVWSVWLGPTLSPPLVPYPPPHLHKKQEEVRAKKKGNEERGNEWHMTAGVGWKMQSGLPLQWLASDGHTSVGNCRATRLCKHRAIGHFIYGASHPLSRFPPCHPPLAVVRPALPRDPPASLAHTPLGNNPLALRVTGFSMLEVWLVWPHEGVLLNPQHARL
jgi:hypothetical protein